VRGRAVDERRWLIECEVAHIAHVQVEFHPRLGRAEPRLGEHRWRGIDADHAPAGCPCYRDRDPAVPDGKLNQRLVCLASELKIETRHRRSCPPTTPRSDPRTPRPSSSNPIARVDHEEFFHFQHGEGRRKMIERLAAAHRAGELPDYILEFVDSLRMRTTQTTS
jgi:hypothetical protein